MPQTLKKEAARELTRQIITRQLKPLIEAQIHNAIGIKHFFMRDENAKFVRITDPDAITQALNEGKEGKNFWIHEKDPSVQAFTDLLNRAIDKPAEHVNIAGHDGGPLVVKWKA